MSHDPQALASTHQEVVRAIEECIFGQTDLIETVLYTMYAGGHVLLEGVPGVGKTMLARAISTVFQLDYNRVQFTPDLMPADITGTHVYSEKTQEFELRQGPVFCQFLLADEINRSPAKTQAALLEAMQERQVTIDGSRQPLGAPYVVMATSNPIEFEGTYPLPEAQVDRFLVKAFVDYPDEDAELRILEARMEGRMDGEDYLAKLPQLDPRNLSALMDATESVYVDRSVLSYVVALVRQTRDHARVQLGASPRGALAILSLARAAAVASGRSFVIPDDVKDVATPAINHRLSLNAESELEGIGSLDILKEVLEAVPVPRGNFGG